MLAFLLISSSYADESYVKFEEMINNLLKEKIENSFCEKDLSFDENFYQCAQELKKDLEKTRNTINIKEEINAAK